MIIQIFIILLVIILLIFLLKPIKITNNFNILTENQNIKNKSRNIWVYWQNINRSTYPTIIKLCMDTMKKYLSKYNLIILDESSIKNYLPDLDDSMLDHMIIAHKVDYYRLELLNKYGGIWIDSDIIIMRDFEPIWSKLDEGWDYVGFGCTGHTCSNGYSKPSNWVMASQPNGKLITKCLEKIKIKINSNKLNSDSKYPEYHDYGKYIIWDSIDELAIESNYKYYHFGSEYDGARDINSQWIHIPNFFSHNPTQFLDESKLIFVVLYNSEFKPDYLWVNDCEESRLTNGKEWICSLFRKSLK